MVGERCGPLDLVLGPYTPKVGDKADSWVNYGPVLGPPQEYYIDNSPGGFPVQSIACQSEQSD